MSYSHFFFIEEKHIKPILYLMQNKSDGEYIKIARSNGFADIIQWSDKYQNLRIITCKETSLDASKELVI